MKHIFASLILLTIFLSAYNYPTQAKEPAQAKANHTDTSPRVIGIGGIFFGTDNPKETRQWYDKHLGITANPYGTPFEFRNANRPEETNYLIWTPFKTGSTYFSPSKKEFMINYRVQNIEGLVRQLKQDSVNVVDTIAVYDYGKFVHIMDNNGYKIELWEPVDNELTKIGSKTIK